MGQIEILSLIAFVLIASMVYNHLKRKEKWKRYIHEKYGKKPKKNEKWHETVRTYYDIADEPGQVDDVTWNDLSMDEVFRRINQCDTSAGEEILYYRLRHTRQGESGLEEKIQYFDTHEAEREELETMLCKVGKADASYYIPSYVSCLEDFRMEGMWKYRGLQLLLAIGLLTMILLRNSYSVGFFLVIMVVNIGVYASVKARYENEIDMLATVVSLILIGKEITKKEYAKTLCPELNELVKQFGKVSAGVKFLKAEKAMQNSGDLASILQDYIIGATMLHLTFYDKVMRSLEKKSREYLDLYHVIGELDAAISVGSFRRSIETYCLPEYTEEKEIYIEEIYHPLLEGAVKNSLKLERGCIITGSNASGKSTFIKAVAVNMILGQGINTCTAEKMRVPRADVITSMAVRDDIMSGESYFIKEIKYLKRILDNLNDEWLTVCAIDEILRGTNTGERIAASQAILQYFRDKNCIAIVASHDRELTKLLQDYYDNYHFSEEIGTEDIVFDYKIQEGPSNTQNAIRLLEYVHFPEEIIREAERL